MTKIFLFLLICYCQLANGQVRRLGVLGSSTANGQGVPFDSSWVQLIGSHYRSAGIIDTFHKVAASTFDCYSGMPTGYIPPAGRNQPNTSYNITRLITRIPLASTVIVNYPTTNFDIYSDAEILFCLDSIRKVANSIGARCYIATTQPRDNFDNAARARLKYLNDVIKNYFGDSAIDFFTILNNPTNNKIKAEFALGDGIHVNSRGHAALYRQVLQKNIFNIDTSSVERILVDVGNAETSTSTQDQFGRYWNNMTDARKGVRVSNALTTKNNSTTIMLEVVNPLGSTAPDNTGLGSSGAVGNVFEYPQSATNDHAFASPSISNGRWRIYGLNPAMTYSVRFWGSQLMSGYRILQVKRSDETIWQEYNASMSKNYNTAASFSFSGKTEMSFDFRVKAGSVMGHINVVDIVGTLPAAAQSLKVPPVSNAGIDMTIFSTDSVRLTGSGYDPDGTVSGYFWSRISGPVEHVLSSAHIADPILKGLSIGSYDFELRVTDNDGLINKDTVRIVVKAGAIPVSTQRVLIDLGLSNALTNSPDQWGKYWNNVTDARPGLRITNAISTTNLSTNLKFEVVNPTGSVASYDLNTRTSNTVGIVGDYPSSATNDNAFVHSSITNGQWKFSGLDISATYTFKFWGSIPQSGSRFVQIKRADESLWKEYNSSNNFDFTNAVSFTFSSVTEMRFDIRVKQGSTFSYINVVDIAIDSKRNSPPIANAGNDVNIRMPVDSIELDGTQSYDMGGTITQFAWRQLSGPTSLIIDDSTSAFPLIKNLIPGIYLLELKVTDLDSLVGMDTISITVLNELINKSPISNAGTDIEIRLPLDSLFLNGGLSNDEDGLIQEYYWNQISGPTPVAIIGAATSNPVLRQLLEGEYVFELTVTDDQLARAKDTMMVVVIAARHAPISRAGPDAQITLPTDSYILDGNNSSDISGSIISYQWKKVSGPAGSTMADSSTSRATVNNMVAGIYVFELAVADNDGDIGLDSVTITVLPKTNMLPTADAGIDQTFNLPANVTLTGSGSDPDGNIASYLWTKISAPSNFTFLPTSMPSVQLANLVSGVYIFQLSVIDDAGGSDYDTVMLTINAEIQTESSRVLIDAGLGNNTTSSPDALGKYWNNLIDARPGLRINNAVTVTNSPTSIKLEVINPAGSLAAYDLNTRTSNNVGSVGDYPASATNDNAFAHSSVTNGLWKISGLEPSLAYTIKFWGSIPLSGNRTIQIKRTDEAVWKEYNSSLNFRFDSAASFNFAGKSEVSFNIRVKQGASYAYINVIDITMNGTGDNPLQTSMVSGSRASQKQIITMPAQTSELSLFNSSSLLNGQSHVEAYPNPTSNIAVLKISNEYQGPVQMIITDVYGRSLKKLSGNKNQKIFSQNIQFNNYATGIYFIKIKMGEKNEIVRIIKAH